MRMESRRFASKAEVEEVDLDALDTDHVVELVLAVGRRLGLAPAEEMERLQLEATLHSIGQLAEPDRVADAQSVYDAAMTSAPEDADDVSDVVRAVGERWDGQGRPDGLKGGAIPLASRVILACEVYDALTARQPGGGGMTPLEACRELVDGAGSQLDPLVVATLIGHLRRTHVLSIVDPEEAGADVQSSAAWSASSSSA